MSNRILPFSPQDLEAVSRVLADTARGLADPRSAGYFQEIRVEDVDPGNTKWKRLYNALAAAQNKHQVGNHLIQFINAAMNPVSYARDRESFIWRRNELNVVLAFSGFMYATTARLAMPIGQRP